MGSLQLAVAFVAKDSLGGSSAYCTVLAKAGLRNFVSYFTGYEGGIGNWWQVSVCCYVECMCACVLCVLCVLCACVPCAVCAVCLCARVLCTCVPCACVLCRCSSGLEA